jgi:hypothetical protein
MTSSVNRIVGWQKSVLYGAGTALLASGGAWLGLHYGRGDDALPSAIEPWAMRLHGLAAFAFLFALGALAATHIPTGWRTGTRPGRTRQRRSGLILCLLAGACALTGYLLYYFAPDTVRPALGFVHSGIGAAAALLVAFHRRGLAARMAGSRRST